MAESGKQDRTRKDKGQKNWKTKHSTLNVQLVRKSLQKALVRLAVTMLFTVKESVTLGFTVSVLGSPCLALNPS